MANKFREQFPCSPADAKRIRSKSIAVRFYGSHPLDGKSVAEWVAEARAGWPKVPVPRDPEAAARKIADRLGE